MTSSHLYLAKRSLFSGDTHMHTDASDGRQTPQELVLRASLLGMQRIAITDHDTTDALKEAMSWGEIYGVDIIPALEIFAEHHEGDLHVHGLEVLGLGINVDKIQPAHRELFGIREKKLAHQVGLYNQYVRSPAFVQENASKRIQLIDHPALTTVGEVQQFIREAFRVKTPDVFPAPWHILKWMLATQGRRECPLVQNAQAGKPETKKLAWNEYAFLINASHPEVRPVSFQWAIERIHDADGKAILAHPGLTRAYTDNGLYKEWEEDQSKWFAKEKEVGSKKVTTPFHFVRTLRQMGLDGIELYNYIGPSHPDPQRINLYMERLADKLDLEVTYGSDCHGYDSNGPQLGKFGWPDTPLARRNLAQYPVMRRPLMLTYSNGKIPS